MSTINKIYLENIKSISGLPIYLVKSGAKALKF